MQNVGFCCHNGKVRFAASMAKVGLLSDAVHPTLLRWVCTHMAKKLKLGLHPHGKKVKLGLHP